MDYEDNIWKTTRCVNVVAETPPPKYITWVSRVVLSVEVILIMLALGWLYATIVMSGSR